MVILSCIVIPDQYDQRLKLQKIQMSEEELRVELTTMHRIGVMTLIVVQCVGFVIGEALFFHYLGLALPAVPYPSLFTANQPETHYTYNICLYLLFLTQHITMATLKYKKFWYSKTKYFALYDRYLYNLSSGLVLWFIFAHLKPSYAYLFALPEWLCAPLSLTGFMCFIVTSLDMTVSTLIPHKLSSILKDRYIPIVPYEGKQTSALLTSGVYGLVRHPMQTSLILIMLFINNVYTRERVLFLVIMISFIVFGVLREEQRLLATEKEYPDYMQKVKARLIPLIY